MDRAAGDARPVERDEKRGDPARAGFRTGAGEHHHRLRHIPKVMPDFSPVMT